MNDIQTFLSDCQHKKILIVGDLMLDRYLWGEVARISPEAPVPVVEVTKEENRLGGAANVALNIQALGAKPVLCGAYGQDKDGEILQELVKKHAFDTDFLLGRTHHRTTVKVRVIGGQQQMLRVDREDRIYLSDDERSHVLTKVAAQIHSFDAIIFQDYDKCFLDKTLIAQLTQLAKTYNIPIIVDPKFKHFFDFDQCTLFKPNLKELNEGLGLRLHKQDIAGITEAVKQLRIRMPHEQSFITLSEYGVLLLDAHLQPHHIPAHYRNITDVSGAGDTVVSLMALGLATGIEAKKAAAYANLAGGLVCEEVGVVPIHREKLLTEAQRLLNEEMRK